MGLFKAVFGEGLTSKAQNELENELADEMLHAAFEALKRMDFKAAGNLLKSASGASDTGLYHITSAVIELRRESYEAALNHFQSVVPASLGPNVPDYCVTMSVSSIKKIMAARKSQDNKAFIAGWNELANNKNNPFYVLYAAIFKELQDEGAFFGYDETSPSTIERYLEQANKYLALKKNREARDLLLEASEKFGQDARILDLLGVCYYNMSKYDDAIECCRQAAKLNRKMVRAFATMALCFNAKGDLREALEAIDEAIYLDSSCISYHELRGDLLYRTTANVQEALDEYQKVLAEEPYNIGVLEKMAKIGHIKNDKWLYKNSLERLRNIDNIDAQVAADMIEKEVNDEALAKGLDTLATGLFGHFLLKQ